MMIGRVHRPAGRRAPCSLRHLRRLPKGHADRRKHSRSLGVFFRTLNDAAPQDSPNIGACLCLGCWLEGGKELMGADVFEAIDWFGGNNPMGVNKLFKVVSATLAQHKNSGPLQALLPQRQTD